MKILIPSTACDLSEASVEQAILDIRHYHHKNVFALILNVSVFNVQTAIRMMIDDSIFRSVRYVHITPEFKDGEFSVQDELNAVIWKSPDA